MCQRELNGDCYLKVILLFMQRFTTTNLVVAMFVAGAVCDAEGRDPRNTNTLMGRRQTPDSLEIARNSKVKQLGQNQDRISQFA